MDNIDKAIEKTDEILNDAGLNRYDQLEAISEEIRKLGLQETNQESETWHWPGMYEPEDDAAHWHTLTMHNDTIEYIGSSWAHIAVARTHQLCCASKKETNFVRAHRGACLKVIDLLKKLNGGWRPDWDDDFLKYEPQYSRLTDKIGICAAQTYSTLPDWFQAKSEEIWRAVIEELGEEKVKLALWPKYEEER